MTYSIGASQVSDLHDGQLALFPPHLILSFKILSPCLLWICNFSSESQILLHYSKLQFGIASL